MAEKRSATEASESARSDASYDSTRRNVRDPRFESSSSNVDAGAGGSPAAESREQVEALCETPECPCGDPTLCGTAPREEARLSVRLLGAANLIALFTLAPLNVLWHGVPCLWEDYPTYVRGSWLRIVRGKTGPYKGVVW